MQTGMVRRRGGRGGGLEGWRMNEGRGTREVNVEMDEVSKGKGEEG